GGAFIRFTESETGRLDSSPATRTSVFRGSVRASDGTSGEAVFTFDEQFVLGRWDEEGITYFLEPLWRFVPDADHELYVVYKEEDAIMPLNYCGTEIPGREEDSEHDHNRAHQRGFGQAPQRSVGECLLVELALASDFELYQDFNNNATSVENFMLNNLANVQTNYDDEFDDEILFEVVTTYIATCNATSCDPWTNSTNAGTLLESFRNWGQGGGFGGVTYDVATLWTGRNFNGGTIGVAWLSGLCTSLRYNTCENFSSNSQTLRVLWSHELGHNFGSGHDNSGGFIMSPSVNTSTTWSGQSQNAINNLVASVNCLSSCGTAEPPTAIIEASAQDACTGSYVAYFDESEGNVTSRFWDFPGGTPSFSTDPHPIVFYPDPGFYSAFLSVENAQGSDFTSFDIEIELDESFRKVVHYANFEDGFDGWFVENPDNDITWERREVEGNLGDFAVYVDNHDYNAPGETDGLISPTFDFSAEAEINLELEYAYARFNAGNRDQLRIYVSTDGGSSFPDLIFEGDETGGGNFATSGDSPNEFVPDESADWCGEGPGCINLDLSDYSGQGNVAILIENVNGWGNNMYVDNVAVTAACGAVEPPTANFSFNTEIGCAPLIVEFQDESIGVITDWEWTFEGGNPEFSLEQNPFTEYNFPGVYDVSLTVSNPIGSDTYTIENAVTVLGAPEVDFTFTNTGLTYNFTDASSADAEDWAWDFGDGNFSFEQNPTHTYAAAGTYVVELEVFNDCGSSTTTQTIVVEPVLRADFISTEAMGCAPLEVKFIDLSEGEPTSWSWQFPGGNPATSTEQNPTVMYNEPGTYDVTLTVMANGETDVITMENMVQILPLPVAAFTATLAPGESSPVITNLSQNATGYFWDFGNGETSMEENPSVTYDEPGTYTITLSATNECDDDIVTQTIEVIFPVSPSFTVNGANGCVPFTTSFTASPQGAGLTYEWSFPGGSPSSSTDPNPSVTYNSAGSYDVTLIITNAAGPATVTETSVVVVNEGPTAAFTAAATPGNLTVTLTDQSSNADNISWDFGDGNTASGSLSSYTYAQEGTYTITLTAENECGTDVATQEVMLILPVTPSITASTSEGCTPLTVNYMANPQIDGQTYAWSFPGGTPTTSTDPNPTVTYNDPGTFSVELTITNAAGPATVTENNMVTVGQGPNAAFTVNSTLGDASISLNNNSSDSDSFFWDFGDGNNSTDTDPTHSYSGEGSYEIMLIATNDCGSDTARQVVEILFAPNPSITASETSGCGPLTVVYEADPQGEGLTYAWNFPGGSPATSDQPIVSVTYDEPGLYSADLTVTNAAGSGTTSTTEPIEVLGAPSVDFTADSPIGQGIVNFTSTSENVTSLSWDFGDGNTGTGAEVTHTYTEVGTYEVVLTGIGPCGEETSTQTVTIVFPPAGGFTSDEDSGCTPQAISFTANDQGEGFAYEWSFPGGEPSTSTEANPTVTYNTAGTYDVLLTVTNAAGMETTTQEDLITIGTLPPASIDLTTEIGSLDVTVEAPNDPSIDSWSWDFGDGTTAMGSTAMHTYAASGTYIITLTTTNECGSNTDEVEVSILTAPTATFSTSALSVCPGETVVLQADETEGVTYSWDIPGGDPSTSTEAMVVTTFANPGSYDVSLSTTNAAGTTTTTQTVIVNPLPVADFSFAVNGLTASFMNFSENATTYTWQFPGTEDTDENPVFTFPGVGSYDVVLIAENDCGVDTRTMTVVLEGSVPSVTFTAEDNEGCDAVTVSFFSDVEDADEIMWSFPGGTPSTSMDPNPMVTYDQPGEYTVTLMATNAFGTNAVTQENIVVVFEPLSAQVTFDLDVTTATFSANTTGVTNFSWTFPDGSTSTELGPTYTFPGNGIYTVEYSFSGPCGSGVSSVEVEIAGELPVVNITLDQNKGCAPFVVTFTDQSSNSPESWSWSFPGGDPETATGPSATVTYATAGIYSISIDVTNAYGTSAMEMIDAVEVLDVPVAPSFTTTTTDDINFDFEVTDPVVDWTYSWSFGDGTTAEGTTAAHTYTEDGMFDVILTAINDCGEASTTETVVAVITSTEAPVWAVGLQLAPNPTPGTLFINAEAWPESGSLRYRLVNALGQEMSNGLWAVGAGNWRQTIDMSRLPAGTYWLQLGWNDELWTQKVIKQ
ncbi:MAG: PKD domain-containing protein, partial [Bacteroidota bacterium]